MRRRHPMGEIAAAILLAQLPFLDERTGKRPASYVPAGVARDRLMRLSKADLAELVWDFAVQEAGGDPNTPSDVMIRLINNRFDAVKAAR